MLPTVPNNRANESFLLKEYEILEVLYETVCGFYKKLTFEQPGVKAPGTANITTFFPAHNSAMFTLFAGESSNKSKLGILSPS